MARFQGLALGQQVLVEELVDCPGDGLGLHRLVAGPLGAEVQSAGDGSRDQREGEGDLQLPAARADAHQRAALRLELVL